MDLENQDQLGQESPEQLEEQNQEASGQESPEGQQAPAGAEGEGDQAVAGAGEGTEPPAYTPNFKFKVMDKEHEIPEFLRGVVKDAETEKQVREIFEKAYGLDVVKPRFQETRETLKTVSKELEGYKSGVNELREYYQAYAKQGDITAMDSFLGKLQIPFEKMLQYVATKLKYEELPTEQRQVLDQQLGAQRQARLLAKQNEILQAQFQQQTSSAKETLLNYGLERPDVKAFADAFDAKAGKPGAFRDAVIDIGDKAWNTRNVDLTPDQAIKEAMDWYGKFVSPQAPAAQPAAQATPPAGAQAAPRKEPPVIPNVQGRAASPTKPKVNSLDDLRKISKQMSGS